MIHVQFCVFNTVITALLGASLCNDMLGKSYIGLAVLFAGIFAFISGVSAGIGFMLYRAERFRRIAL